MKLIGRFYVLIAWAYLIFVLLTAPMPYYEGDTITYYDKAVHAFLFGIFVILAVRAFIQIPGLAFKSSLLISILLSVTYSGSGEYLQSFVPGRTVSELDFLGGVVGILIGAIIAFEKYNKRKR